MDRLKQLMKGFKYGSSEGISVSVDSSIRNQALASLDCLTEYNDYEGDDRKIVKAAVKTANLEEDKQPPRALSEILDAKSPQENGSCQPTPYQLFLDFWICSGCKTEIGQRHFVSSMREFWHSECFLCHACNQPTNDYEFSNTVGSPYHASCYKDHPHAPICRVCEQINPRDTKENGRRWVAAVWKQDACILHRLDGTPCCCSCQRLEPRDTNFVTLGDGRVICLECLDSAIMDTNECQPLYTQIKEFFANLDMKIEQDIPIALVDKQIMQKEDVEGLDGVKGLCCMSQKKEDGFVSSISRECTGDVEKLVGTKEPYKPPNRRLVDKILILYGLPRLETGCILAHEMMHAWFWINGYQNLREEVEEGICMVLEHMWLESELNIAPGSIAASNVSCWSSWSSLEKYSRLQLEWKLGAVTKDRIETDVSSVYGDGFRAGRRAVSQFGLKNTLDHIRHIGSFPC